MRVALLLFLFAPLAALGAEEKTADPLAGLPRALRPTAKAKFTQLRIGETLRGTVEYRVLEGETPGTVRIVREYATKDLGPLTARHRITAVLDVESRRIRSIHYELGGEKSTPLRTYVKVIPYAKKAGTFVHERYRYPAKGKPKIRRRRFRPARAWGPEFLEPFLVATLAPTEERAAQFFILDLVTGRLGKSPAVYRRLGDGKMKLGESTIPCSILGRTLGDKTTRTYLRASDSMPVRADAAGLRIVLARTEREGVKKTDSEEKNR